MKMSANWQLSGDNAMTALSQIGNELQLPHNNSPSALIGNYTADTTNFTLEEHIRASAHLRLRSMIGKIGRRVDWKALSTETCQALEDAGHAKKRYAAAVRPLIKFHTDIIEDVEQEEIRKKLANKNYTELETLNVRVNTALRCVPNNTRRQRVAERDEIKWGIDEAEQASIPVISRLMTQLEQEKEFQLVGEQRVLQNRYVLPTKLKGNPLQILHSYDQGSKALADTTRIPNHYAMILSILIGNSRMPLTRLPLLLAAAPQLKHPLIYAEIEAAYGLMQRDVAAQSTFSELQCAGDEMKKIVGCLGLDDEDVYNSLCAQAPEMTDTPKHETRPAGRCPFGHG